MRAGPNWAAHQTLTAEAATVLRHSLGLARQRRHAQLTPLHVAAALLTFTRPSILLQCCLASSPPRSLPHALQNRALELCFSVALNRLPTAPTIPLLNTHNVSPSNALAAALKRAQANQRRGCSEQQNQQGNQQFVGIMVELEQLIISILDDPSVSRVLRDAGLSSTAVKGHIEEYFSSVSASASFHGSSIHEGIRNPCQVMEIKNSLNQVKEGEGLFSCCVDCTYNYEKEADLLKCRRLQKGRLPYWIQQQSEDIPNKGDELAELRKKWSRLCQSLHWNYASKNISKAPYPYQWWPTHDSVINPGATFGAVKTNHGGGGGKNCNFMEEPVQSLYFFKNGGGNGEKINLSLGNYSVSGDLLRVLKENVPWQSENIAPIVDALMNPRKPRRDTWLMIQGDDTIGKRRLACAIAESLLGSAEFVVYFNMKEARDDAENRFDEMLKKGSRNRKLLVLVENVDLGNTRFLNRLAELFDAEGEEDNGGELVFVLTKGDHDCNEGSLVIQMLLEVNDPKRKLGFGFSSKIKKQRINNEDPVSGTIEYLDATKRKDRFFFDLNVEADDELEANPEGSSPNSSELTQEEQPVPFSFLESIENRFLFDRSLTRETEMAEFFSSKLMKSFDKVYGFKNMEFGIEDSVLQKILGVSGFLSGHLLEKWLEDIFQTSLNIVRISGRSVGGSVRLCIGDRKEEGLDEGYLSSCLPKEIEVRFGN